MPTIQEPKISPFLWFNDQAEEARAFYVDIFPDSKLLQGNSFIFPFEITGMKFTAMNTGQDRTYTEAISFFINCDDQTEVDYYWEKLTANGGQEGPCGWCKDPFGISWQVIPKALPILLNDPDQEKAKRATQAMMGMSKIIVKELEEA